MVWCWRASLKILPWRVVRLTQWHRRWWVPRCCSNISDDESAHRKPIKTRQAGQIRPITVPPTYPREPSAMQFATANEITSYIFYCPNPGRFFYWRIVSSAMKFASLVRLAYVSKADSLFLIFFFFLSLFLLFSMYLPKCNNVLPLMYYIRNRSVQYCSIVK